jgi:hypothetical protein
MSNDIDFDQLIELLDRALVSDDPKVQKALKKFLFIVALSTEEDEEAGPLRDLISRIEDLERKVAGIPWGGYQWPNTSPTYPGPYWVGDNTHYYGGGTSTAGGTTTVFTQTLANTYGNENTSWNFNASDISEWATITTKAVEASPTDMLIDDAMNDLTDLQEQAKEALAK